MASSSFLDKLKKRGFEEEGGGDSAPMSSSEGEGAAVKMPEGEMQLDIDMYQTPSEVVLITQIAGVTLKEVAIGIEGENDVVVIQGEKKLPDIKDDDTEPGNMKFIHQEGHWGSFYRRILLPGEVLPGEADAEFDDGVLVLRLPLAKPSAVSGQQIRIHRREDDDDKKKRSSKK
jgi:HSP20 family molecular chaperone IbpA